MAIDQAELARNIADYNRVTGHASTRFVCPITLEQCDESELVNGHILNAGFLQAERRTVIQRATVDNFYGTRVEASLVDYLNRPETTERAYLDACDAVKVIFANGSEAEALYFGDNEAAINDAAAKFPVLPLERDGKLFAKVVVKIAMDDPRANEPRVQLSLRDHWVPAHWNAALIKAAYLTIFDCVGYRSVYAPYANTVRNSLASYFRDNGSRDDASEYFRHYEKASQILGMSACVEGEKLRLRPFEYDSLRDRMFLFHHTDAGVWFAMTCIFKINRGTYSVALPQGKDGADAAQTLRLYDRLMDDHDAFPHQVMRMKFFDEQRGFQEEQRMRYQRF